MLQAMAVADVGRKYAAADDLDVTCVPSGSCRGCQSSVGWEVIQRIPIAEVMFPYLFGPAAPFFCAGASSRKSEWRTYQKAEPPHLLCLIQLQKPSIPLHIRSSSPPGQHPLGRPQAPRPGHDLPRPAAHHHLQRKCAAGCPPPGGERPPTCVRPAQCVRVVPLRHHCPPIDLELHAVDVARRGRDEHHPSTGQGGGRLRRREHPRRGARGDAEGDEVTERDGAALPRRRPEAIDAATAAADRGRRVGRRGRRGGGGVVVIWWRHRLGPSRGCVPSATPERSGDGRRLAAAFKSGRLWLSNGEGKKMVENKSGGGHNSG